MTRDRLDEVLDQIEKLLSPIRLPIPAQFHRTFEDRPFDTCDFCGRALRVTGTRYMIAKYYSAGELRQEVSLCAETMGALRKCYSEPSLKSMEQWYSPKLISARMEFARSLRGDLPQQLTERCVFCSRPKSELSEYFEYAQCEGSELLCLTYPSMQCGGCTLKILNSLSAPTLEMRRRFFEEHFGLPPNVNLGVWAESELSALG
jgi:hypothetical protein